MIARLTFAALMIILSGWLYVLTCRVQVLIDLAEQLIDRDHVVLPEPVPLFRKLRAAAAKVDARMQPVMADEVEPEVANVVPLPELSITELAVMYGGGELSGEEFDAEMDRRIPVPPEQPATEPAPVVRPSPVPREPATVPLERAWEESAAELTEQQQWEAEQEAKYAAAMARIEEMAKGVA